MVEAHQPSLWKSEARNIAVLAGPVVAVQLGVMAMGAVDAMVVGHLSRQALAAVTLGHVFTMAVMVFGWGILLALDPLVAQAVGAGDEESVARWLQRGTVLALVLSVVLGSVFLFADPLLRLARQPEEILPDTLHYVRICAFSVPGFFLFAVLRQTLQALGRTGPLLKTVLVANVVNAVLDWALVFGHLGLPALGVRGSAIATTVSRWLLFGGLFWFGAGELRRYRRPWGRALGSFAAYRRFLSIGLPTGVQVSLELWVFSAASLIVGSLGATQLAGHQIAINLASLSFMIPLGIGAAAAARVGRAIGAGDPARARCAAALSLLLGAGVMTLSAALFLAVPEALSRAYTPDREAIAMACRLLPLAALFQIFDGTQVVACGVLRGAADTRIAALVNFAGYWLLAVPVGALLTFRAGAGAPGMWWGLTLGLGVVSVLLVWRVRTRFFAAAPPALPRSG